MGGKIDQKGPNLVLHQCVPFFFFFWGWVGGGLSTARVVGFFFLFSKKSAPTHGGLDMLGGSRGAVFLGWFLRWGLRGCGTAKKPKNHEKNDSWTRRPEAWSLACQCFDEVCVWVFVPQMLCLDHDT